MITVKKAWEELEHEGLIYTIAGKGCFVAEMHAEDLDSKRNQFVRERLMKDIHYYKSLGFSKSDIIELIKRYYDD